jgi:predicted nucleic acid-binding protein
VRAYVDSSALVKRVIRETESTSLIAALRDLKQRGFSIQTSVLGAIEVSRGIRARLDLDPPTDVVDSVELALAGIEQVEISEPVVTLARRLFPISLRSLDAIHLASALLVNANVVVAYDRRLLTAASELGFRTLSPGMD